LLIFTERVVCDVCCEMFTYIRRTLLTIFFLSLSLYRARERKLKDTLLFNPCRVRNMKNTTLYDFFTPLSRYLHFAFLTLCYWWPHFSLECTTKMWNFSHSLCGVITIDKYWVKERATRCCLSRTREREFPNNFESINFFLLNSILFALSAPSCNRRELKYWGCTLLPLCWCSAGEREREI
jgi:hypothetical protein